MRRVAQQQQPPPPPPPPPIVTYSELPLDFGSRACIVCVGLLAGVAALAALVAAWYAASTYAQLTDFVASATL